MADNDSETGDTTPIPTNLRDIYERIKNELVEVHIRWKLYRQLFGTNEVRIQLLNETAPTLFGQLQLLWFDYVVMDICRITDPTETRGEENLVISQLRHRLDTLQHAILIDELDTLHATVKESREKLRVQSKQADCAYRSRRCLGTV